MPELPICDRAVAFELGGDHRVPRFDGATR